MTSQIDPSVFPDNVLVRKGDLREQFEIAHNEITALQRRNSFSRDMAFSGESSIENELDNAVLRANNLRDLQSVGEASANISAAIYKDNVLAVNLIAEATATTVIIAGRVTFNDGGGGIFSVKAGDTTTPDDGVMVLVDALGRRWWRVWSGDVNLKWFALGNGSTDDYAAMQAAIDLVSTTGGRLACPTGVYRYTQALEITSGGVTIVGLPDNIVEFNCDSDTEDHLRIGAQGSPYIFNVGVHNITFSRGQVATAGFAIDMCNVGYSNFTKCRIYGNNEQYQGIRVRSCNQLLFREWTSDNILKQTLIVEGLSASVAAQDGNIVDVIIDDWNSSGGQAGAGTPATTGIFEFRDFVGGVWLNKIMGHSHIGYMIYLNGTAPNVADNQLIYINGLNVESTFAGSGALKVDNYRGVYVESTEWVSGRDLDTIHFGSGASTIRYSGKTVALAYTAIEKACMYVDCVDVQIFGVSCTGYSTNAHGTGIYIGPNADQVSFLGGKCNQLFRGIDVDAASRTGKQIDFNGVAFFNNNNNSNINLAADVHIQIIGCYGLPTLIRDASSVSIGGSQVTAPIKVITDDNYVDGIDVRGGVSGQNAVSFTARGSDTDISMNFNSKGAGGFNFSNGAGQLAGAFYGGTLTSGQTGLYLSYHNGSLTAALVEVGGPDSGGTGRRVLTVPN